MVYYFIRRYQEQKAVELLEKMALDFQGSLDVKIHLTDAYISSGRTDDASKVIKYQFNFFFNTSSIINFVLEEC